MVRKTVTIVATFSSILNISTGPSIFQLWYALLISLKVGDLINCVSQPGFNRHALPVHRIFSRTPIPRPATNDDELHFVRIEHILMTPPLLSLLLEHPIWDSLGWSQTYGNFFPWCPLSRARLSFPFHHKPRIFTGCVSVLEPTGFQRERQR